MTTTLFKLLGAQPRLDVDLKLLQQALPPSMRVEDRPDGLYVLVDTPIQDDPAAQALMDRELDRLHFLTCVEVRAEMCTRTVISDLRGSYRIHGNLPPDVRPQVWKDPLPLQLKLWSLAASTDDPPSKVLLLFQIIELSHPNTSDPTSYPRYCDARVAPNPRTEAKLLRHMVAHAGSDIRPELEKYLSHIGLKPMLANHIDPAWRAAIASRVASVQQQAEATIKEALRPFAGGDAPTPPKRPPT